MDGAHWKKWRPTSSPPRPPPLQRGFAFSESPEQRLTENLDCRPLIASSQNQKVLITSPRKNSVRFHPQLNDSSSRRAQFIKRKQFSTPLPYNTSRTSSDDDDYLSDTGCSPKHLIKRKKGECRTRWWIEEKSRLDRCCAPDALHAWTSRDLRYYLVKKAREKLGSPQESNESDCEETDLSTSSNERTSIPVGVIDTQTTYTTTTTSSFLRKDSINRPRRISRDYALPSPRSAELEKWHLQHRGNVGPRGSLQLDRVCEWFEPRPRLWSLPTIIVTKWDASDSGGGGGVAGDQSNPGATEPATNTSSPMHYLTVPQSPPYLETPVRGPSTSPRHNGSIRKSSSCSELVFGNSDDDEFQEFPGIGEQTSTLQLGSLLALWPPQADDEDTDSDSAGIISGSAEVLTYENSFPEIAENERMYGRYSADLAEYALKEGQRLKTKEEPRDEEIFKKELHKYKGATSRVIVSFVRPIWNNTFAYIGEDWVFLFVLGILMATVSFTIDYFIGLLFYSRMMLYDLLKDIHWGLALFGWVIIPSVLVMIGILFTAYVAPSAAGSGIPEMKTVLRGVVLKEYLTWKTLVAKMVGLTTVIGAGLPLGKEGPVMHMASIVATMLSKLLVFIKGIHENEQRNTDLLAAACTMGVAVCYAAPIGGVLFSIEVTTTYFAVRNYWRGFFAAVVGALFYRLMGVWFQGNETIYPLFQVSHNFVYPYDVIELFPHICVRWKRCCCRDAFSSILPTRNLNKSKKSVA